jgi:hypothetical protein
MTDSYKIDNYQYLKPELKLEIEVDPSLSLDKQIDEAQDYIIERLDRFIQNRIKSMK